MPKYYELITEKTVIEQKIGGNLVVPYGFYEMSATLVSRSSHIQSLIQDAIYITHGSELIASKQALRKFPSPKARLNFLCSYPYSDSDPIVSKVFDYARLIFRDVYELRNVLSHERWSSGDDYPGKVIFSTLDDEAELLMATGRIWHVDKATPQEAFDASVRYIRSLKLVSCDHLRTALSDAALCTWMLMTIGMVLIEEDPVRKDDLRNSFLVYNRTRHLFGDAVPTVQSVSYSSVRNKQIRG